MTRYRGFLAAGLLAAFLLGGVVSWYASGSPDGLERVAADQGFAQTAEDHSLSSSPFAEYGAKGVENGRLAGGLAGLAGVTMTLLVGGGLFMLIRRRPQDGEPDAAAPMRDDASTT